MAETDGRRELTPRLRLALDQFRRLSNRAGRSPSGPEVGAAMGLAQPHHGNRYLARLAELEYLERGKGARAYRLPAADAGLTLPVLGPTAAGEPIEPFGPGTDRFSFTDHFGAPDLFVVSVRGNSMVDAHIADGDKAVVRSISAAVNGQTVLCRHAGGHTLKVYRKRGRRVWLEPRNAALAPIDAGEDGSADVEMVGVLVAHFRVW